MKLMTCLLLAALIASPAFAAEKDPSKCAKLRVELKSIDAKARQRSTNRLQERRREVRARMHELRCSHFD